MRPRPTLRERRCIGLASRLHEIYVTILPYIDIPPSHPSSIHLFIYSFIYSFIPSIHSPPSCLLLSSVFCLLSSVFWYTSEISSSILYFDLVLPCLALRCPVLSCLASGTKALSDGSRWDTRFAPPLSSALSVQIGKYAPRNPDLSMHEPSRLLMSGVSDWVGSSLGLKRRGL
jgi:hypothetical protein